MRSGWYSSNTCNTFLEWFLKQFWSWRVVSQWKRNWKYFWKNSRLGIEMYFCFQFRIAQISFPHRLDRKTQFKSVEELSFDFEYRFRVSIKRRETSFHFMYSDVHASSSHINLYTHDEVLWIKIHLKTKPLFLSSLDRTMKRSFLKKIAEKFVFNCTLTR